MPVHLSQKKTIGKFYLFLIACFLLFFLFLPSLQSFDEDVKDEQPENYPNPGRCPSHPDVLAAEQGGHAIPCPGGCGSSFRHVLFRYPKDLAQTITWIIQGDLPQQ